MHCRLNALESKYQYDPWSWKMMKNTSKKWLKKTHLSTWVFLWIFFWYSIFFIDISLMFFSHMMICVCNAKLMKSLDFPPKARAFHVYVEIVAIAHATTSTLAPHMETKRLSSQVESFFLLEAINDHSIWINLIWFSIYSIRQLIWFDNWFDFEDFEKFTNFVGCNVEIARWMHCVGFYF